MRGRGLSLARLRAAPHGIDLGPLEPRLPGLLHTKNKRIQLAPQLLIGEVTLLAQELDRPQKAGALVLIGRRALRSNNSWLHNAQGMVKGPKRCTLLMHPDDARARGLVEGSEVRVRSRVGAVSLSVEVTSEMMVGVVSLPHGWGHDRPGTRMATAHAHAGVSANDVTDDAFLDRLTGTASFSGVSVTVEAVVQSDASEPMRPSPT